MKAPVPLTAVSAEELEAMSTGPLISRRSATRQFYGNQTPKPRRLHPRRATAPSTCAASASTAR